MQRILSFVVDIFTFADPMASAVFYLALVLVPAASWYLGKASPQQGSKIMGWVFKGAQWAIFVVGIGLVYQIATDSTDYQLGDKVDGKEVVALDVRKIEKPVLVREGGYYEFKKVNSEEMKQELLEEDADGRFIEHEGELYEPMQKAPDQAAVLGVYLSDDTHKKIIQEAHWNEQMVSLALQMSFIIVYLLFGLMLGFGIAKLIEQPKRALIPLIMVAGLIAIILIGYSMEGSFFEPLSIEFLGKFEQGTITDADQKDAGGSIIATFILIGLAVVTWIGGEIYKMVR